MKINPSELAKLVTEQVIKNLRLEVRKIVREEIQLNEQLSNPKKKELAIDLDIEEMPIIREQKRPVQKQQIIVQRKKIKSGVSEALDNILNDESLLEDIDNDSMVMANLGINDNTNYFDSATQTRASQTNKVQQLVHNKKQVINEQVQDEAIEYWNELVDRMEENAKENKHNDGLGRSLLAQEAGVSNTNIMYDPNAISKLKLPI